MQSTTNEVMIVKPKRFKLAKEMIMYMNYFIPVA